MKAFTEPDLPNIEALIEGGGQITVGALTPFACVAIASTDHGCLAMLQRHDNEALPELLLRLDAAIYNALEYDFFTDEINTPTPTRRRR